MISCVADTSALVALSSAHSLHTLQVVFSHVFVPQAVYREIVTDGVGWKEARQAQMELEQGLWMETVPVVASSRLRGLQDELGGSGEAQAIELAANLGIPIFLDEMPGRKAALRLGLEVIGSLGILRRAKLTGAIDQIAPIVRVRLESGIYYSDALIEQFLREMGESWRSD